MNIEKIKESVANFLEAIGEDINRPGLRETPKRVANMYKEVFSGISDDPKKYVTLIKEENLTKDFVCINNIPVYSVCEHHLLPFFGTVDVIYLPRDNQVLGLSKFSRIIDCFARRPQIQERLTNEIAQFLFSSINPFGLAVRIQASHLCMLMRGVRAIGSQTTTFSFKGNLKTDSNLKEEAYFILKSRE